MDPQYPSLLDNRFYVHMKTTDFVTCYRCPTRPPSPKLLMRYRFIFTVSRLYNWKFSRQQ